MAPLPTPEPPPDLPPAVLKEWNDLLAFITTNEMSPRTRRAHARSWSAWSSYCDENGLELLAPQARDVVSLLFRMYPDMADGGTYRAGTLRKVVDGIGYGLKCAGVAEAPLWPVVEQMLTGIARSDPLPARRKTPLRIDDMRQIAAVSRVPCADVQRDRLALALLLATGASWPAIADTVLLESASQGLLVRISDTEVLLSPTGNPSSCPVLLAASLRAGARGNLLLGDRRSTPDLDRTLARRIGIAARRAGADLATGDRVDYVWDWLDMDGVRLQRNWTLVCVAWAGALRSVEVRNIRANDIEALGDDLLLRLRVSKVDRHGRSEWVRIPAARRAENDCICPVSTLRRWIATTDVSGEMLLFPSARLDGPVGYGLVRKAFRQLTSQAELDGDWATHSGRRGYATCAAEAGYSLLSVAAGGRWRELRSAQEYVDTAATLEDPDLRSIDTYLADL